MAKVIVLMTDVPYHDAVRAMIRREGLDRTKAELTDSVESMIGMVGRSGEEVAVVIPALARRVSRVARDPKWEMFHGQWMVVGAGIRAEAIPAEDMAAAILERNAAATVFTLEPNGTASGPITGSIPADRDMVDLAAFIRHANARGCGRASIRAALPNIRVNNGPAIRPSAQPA